MTTDVLVIPLAFGSALTMGLTAVLLKRAHVDSALYGLVVRSLGSVPFIIILALLVVGPLFFLELASPLILGLVILAAISLIGADLLIMSILKRKPVGLIAPLMAIFPLFTSFLLLLTGQVAFNLPIILLTGLVVIGVALVTYDPSLEGVSFDREAIVYGLTIALLLGVTNFADIVILQLRDLEGLGYTSLKFGMLLVLGTISFVALGHSSQISTYMKNRSSTYYLLLAGMTAWGIGSYLLYSAYSLGDPQVVNAIIGTNPIFAVLISLFWGMEEFKWLKILGLLCCVVAAIGIVNL